MESRLSFIDGEDQTRAFQKCQRCAYFHPLQEGDQILAVDGHIVHSSYEALQRLQTRHLLIAVERNPQAVGNILWTQADAQFNDFGTENLSRVVSSIGTEHSLTVSGTVHLLRPVVPQPVFEIPLSPAQKSQMIREFAAAKKDVEAISDPQKRSEQLSELEKSQKKLVLGISLRDREVRYNPSPLQQFFNVFNDTWRTLVGLVSGALNPKYLSGPVGIVHVVHNSWMVGAKEALFWMAFISLNLGFLNLLPLPILDGGHVLFSLLETVTKRPIRSKTMERLILPFVGLLIALFIYITYHDITRLFSKFF